MRTMLARLSSSVLIVLAILCCARGSAATLIAGTGDTAANGHSTTVPYTFSIGPYNQFNPALGGLRDMDFNLQANLFGQVHPVTSIAGTFSVELVATFAVSEPNTTTTIITDQNAYESDPGEFVPAGGAIFVESGQATTDYVATTLTPMDKIALFSHFIGTGTYMLPVNADKIATVTPAPNGGYTSGANARAVIGVTYTYGPASTTAVETLVAIYDTSAQNGSLRGTLTSGGAPITGGIVYFVLTNGAVQIGSTAMASPNGAGIATAAFTLPAGQAVGTYTLTATYDGGSNYGLSQGSAPFYVRLNEIFANGFEVP